MSLPDQFMHDPDVIAALNNLNTALEAALTARGSEVKTLVVVCHTTLGYNGGGLLGCDCMGCKRAIADTFGEVIGAKATMVKLPSDVKSPIKAVH